MKRTCFIILFLLILSDGYGQYDPRLNRCSFSGGIIRRDGGKISKADKIFNSGCRKLFGSDKDRQEAIVDFQEAIRRGLDQKFQASAYYSIGLAKCFLQDYAGSIPYFTKALDTSIESSDDEASYFAMGIAKINIGDYTGAVADISKAIEKVSYFPDKMYLTRGEVKVYLGDNLGAMADFDKACNEDFKRRPSSEAFLKRGMLKSQLKDKKGAIVDFNKAIEKFSEYDEAYYHRGLAKISLGQKKSGCLDLSKAGELGYIKAYEAIRRYCQ